MFVATPFRNVVAADCSKGPPDKDACMTVCTELNDGSCPELGGLADEYDYPNSTYTGP